MDHTGALRKRIGELTGIGANTAAVERRILEAATERPQGVNADIDTLRPRVAIDPVAAERYQALVAERGRLQLVIANSRQVLG